MFVWSRCGDFFEGELLDLFLLFSFYLFGNDLKQISTIFYSILKLFQTVMHQKHAKQQTDASDNHHIQLCFIDLRTIFLGSGDKLLD